MPWFLVPKGGWTVIRFIVFAISLSLILTSSSSTQEPRCVYPRMDLVDASIHAKVTLAGDRFQHQYLVENRQGARQILDSFAIEAHATSAVTVAQITPQGWRSGGRIADTRFHAWSVRGATPGLTGGQSASGFGFANADLPGVVRLLAWGEVEPPVFPEGQEPDFCENQDLLTNSFKGFTVGPKPPQSNLSAIEFLNYLITLVHDSRRFGWIRVDGVQRSLLTKLLNAKRRLEMADFETTRNIVKAFLQEVEGASCKEFACPGNRPLTSDAYALLFFNGQYFVSRLP